MSGFWLRAFRFFSLFWITAALVIGITLQVYAQSTPQLSATQLSTQGRNFYATGRYTQALSSWQLASEKFEQQEDLINHASLLSNIAIAQLALGASDAAAASLAQAQVSFESVSSSVYADRIHAQILSAQGQLSQAQGDFEAAVAFFSQSTDYYQRAHDIEGSLRAQLYQSSLLHRQGREQDALRLLSMQQDKILPTLPADASFKSSGFRQLGLVFFQMGHYEQAKAALTASLEAANVTGAERDISEAYLALGNLDRGQDDGSRTAATHYKQAIASAPTALLRSQAQVNLLGIWLTASARDVLTLEDAKQLLTDTTAELLALPPGRDSSLVRLNLAIHLIDTTLTPQSFSHPALSDAFIASLLAETVEAARILEDKTVESYALGYLGHLYEQRDRLVEALTATQQAITVGMERPTDSAYRWYWQLGRIFNRQNQPALAVGAYREAKKIIEGQQSSAALLNPSEQFSFQQEIEPVYRELASLLLNEADSLNAETKTIKNDETQNPEAQNIKEAQEVIASLQKAELINFFRADCIDSIPQPIGEIANSAQNTAIIHPVILDDRLEIIVQIPNQPLRHQSMPVDKDELESLVQAFSQKVGSLRSDVQSSGGVGLVIRRETVNTKTQAELSSQLYDYLITPIKRFLVPEVDTLVFILDGSLRNIPLAALYNDSQQEYLVEEYAIALSSGLELSDTPETLDRQNLTALVAVLSESVKSEGTTYPKLEEVNTEVEAIKQYFPSSIVLRNRDFTKENFKENLTSLPFPIVHLATHGAFGKDLESTFVLTHEGQRLSAPELSSFLQFSEVSRNSAVELLVLSACDTAKGGDLAALGLAGIAVRSGARSTLATLWAVNDASTAAFMSEFYSGLHNTAMSKARIIQAVQKQFIESSRTAPSAATLNQPDYSDPYYWAPFILLGNWL